MVMVFQSNIVGHVVEPKRHGRETNPLPHVTYSVGVDGKTLETPRNCAAFLAHYPEKQDEVWGPLRRLQFIHIGSSECPDMSRFSNSCKSVEFSGHISSAPVPFQIIRQLNVKKVVFVIGKSQGYYLYDPYEKMASATPPCPNVKKLKIKMDLEHFHDHGDCQHPNPEKCINGTCNSDRKFSLVCLVKTLLKNACSSFPNLENLVVDFPKNDRLREAVDDLIEACSNLRLKRVSYRESTTFGPRKNPYKPPHVNTPPNYHNKVPPPPINSFSNYSFPMYNQAYNIIYYPVYIPGYYPGFIPVNDPNYKPGPHENLDYWVQTLD